LLWGSAPLCQSLAGCGPNGEGGVYTQGGQTYYGAFTGLINNQAISQKYHNSSGGPVVAFAQATWDQNSGSSNYNSLQISAERRAQMGVNEQMVRLSVGIENGDDLIADLERALEAVGARQTVALRS